ncbi:MAG: AIR synthase-related protein, partial [bacterium]|nr:AIR synthase-related protein [bacterium]
AALIDNFIWPFPDEESLWDLNRAVEACLNIMEVFGIPFVSGKDSLSSTYRRGDFVLKIPPVLCVSVFGKIPDVTKTVTSDFKQIGSHIVLVGKPDTDRLGGSVYFETSGQVGSQVPQVDLQGLPILFDWLHSQITQGNVLACHDISEGGMAATLAEMCFGGNRGAQVNIPPGYEGRLDHWFFNETAGCFLLEVPSDRVNQASCSAPRSGVQSPFAVIGMVTDTDSITFTRHDNPLFSLTLDALKESWKRPMKEVFH